MKNKFLKKTISIGNRIKHKSSARSWHTKSKDFAQGGFSQSSQNDKKSAYKARDTPTHCPEEKIGIFYNETNRKK